MQGVNQEMGGDVSRVGSQLYPKGEIPERVLGPRLWCKISIELHCIWQSRVSMHSPLIVVYKSQQAPPMSSKADYF